MVKDRIAKQGLLVFVTPCHAVHHPAVPCASRSHHRCHGSQVAPGMGAVGDERTRTNNRKSGSRKRKKTLEAGAVRQG